MPILENVEKKKDQIKGSAAIGEANQALAVAAIIGGLGSPAWERYMEQYIDRDQQGFPTDPRQLKRLMGTDNTKSDPEMQIRRAYLVANAVCAHGTGDGLTRTVDTVDNNL